jgi:hypothetical protein
MVSFSLILFGTLLAVSDGPARCPELMSEQERARWTDLLLEAGGRIPHQEAYAQNWDGFQQYLIDAGGASFRAEEVTSPNNPAAARRCGFERLLPPPCLWIRGAALVVWTDRLSRDVGESIEIRNWYRPACYNRAVGGAAQSDHIEARAVDMDFASAEGRRKAQELLCSPWNRGLNMQAGLGARTIHLGFESPRGKRMWYYGSYADRDRNTNCYSRALGGKKVLPVPAED